MHIPEVLRCAQLELEPARAQHLEYSMDSKLKPQNSWEPMTQDRMLAQSQINQETQKMPLRVFAFSNPILALPQWQRQIEVRSTNKNLIFIFISLNIN